MDQKGQYLAKNNPKCILFGILISGNLLDTCFVLRILAGEAPMGRSERKSAIYTQKFWYFGHKVIFCFRAPDFAYDLFVALARRSISHLWTSARGLDKFLHKNINHQKCIQKQNCYKLCIPLDENIEHSSRVCQKRKFCLNDRIEYQRYY